MKNSISDALISAAKDVFSIECKKVPITIPDNQLHGDYASSLAFVLAKELGMEPIVVAEKLREEVLRQSDLFARVDVAAPGFINFFIKDEVVIRASEGRPLVSYYAGKRVLVEHSSPNLFKPFTVGHLMNNIVGESLVHGMKAGGADVISMSFPSDASLGIAKAMFIFLQKEQEFRSLKTTYDKVTFLGNCYVEGVAYFRDHADKLEEARRLARVIYDEASGSRERELFEEVRLLNNEYLRRDILQNFLNSTIENVVYESEVSGRGVALVRENVGKVFQESEGAVVYVPDESRKDLHTQVFINQEGHPTYEAKDIGLLEWKFTKNFDREERFDPEYSFFVTDNEQVPHFKIVMDAAAKLGEQWEGWVSRSRHVTHGRMLFKGQKMSSRLGGVPTAVEVIGALEEEVMERFGEKVSHLSESEKSDLAHAIALSSLRIAVLRSKPGIPINFDPETSLSFDGDSGPYLQYTHARCASLLRRGEEVGVLPRYTDEGLPEVLRLLIHAEEKMEESINEHAPQKLVAYLFSVAQGCNSYYASTQIIDEENKRTTAHKLAVIRRAKTVIARGLEVLGIVAVDVM